MARENKSRYALLGMLTYGSMSGYDMKQLSDHSIGHFWNENYGNIYPVLKKMETEGLVTMERQESEGAPARKVYTITDAGRDVFSDWMKRPPDRTKLRDELLLQVFFGQWAGAEDIIAKLRGETARCAEIIEELEGIRRHMENGENIEESESAEERRIKETGTPYWKSTVLYGLNFYRGIQEWCAQTISEMERQQET